MSRTNMIIIEACFALLSTTSLKDSAVHEEFYFNLSSNRLTDNEWQAEHKFLNVFSPAAALPEAFFFFAGIFII